MFGQTHRLPFSYSPNGHCFPTPSTLSPSHVLRTIPLPVQFPKSCPTSAAPLNCNLPKPLLEVGFPVLGLTHPVSYRARLEIHRQAVTHIAEKKQCSVRKTEKELSCLDMLKMHLCKKVYLLACFLLHTTFLACFIDVCVILLLLLLLLIELLYIYYTSATYPYIYLF